MGRKGREVRANRKSLPAALVCTAQHVCVCKHVTFIHSRDNYSVPAVCPALCSALRGDAEMHQVGILLGGRGMMNVGELGYLHKRLIQDRKVLFTIRAEWRFCKIQNRVVRLWLGGSRKASRKKWHSLGLRGRE